MVRLRGTVGDAPSSLGQTVNFPVASQLRLRGVSVFGDRQSHGLLPPVDEARDQHGLKKGTTQLV